ncbi:MAG: type 4a pilus biogenesis protein PilO [Acidobacteriia bacterium]|nr:type 4a pilus biogenesis protein PilO [Terriglobia bacterium]
MAFENFKLENLPRKIQIAVVAVLAIGVAVAGYWFLLKDLVEVRGKLQTEIAGLEKAVAQASDVERRLDQFKRDLAALDVRLDELRRILPSQKETPDVLRAVQLMASESKLKIIKFAPKPVAPRTFYADWPIQMEVQGSYNALGGFFEKVGQFRRIVNVDDINIKNLEGSTDPTRTLSSTCTATTFVYREDQGTVPVK